MTNKPDAAPMRAAEQVCRALLRWTREAEVDLSSATMPLTEITDIIREELGHTEAVELAKNIKDIQRNVKVALRGRTCITNDLWLEVVEQAHAYLLKVKGE